ncbi:chymotrypsin-2 [Tribolium castaneum]|uniref:chymotrypsin-2 n=1 Tax=Tribolium castaneum TaxID=7070 RepID=UPI0030FE6BC4
MYRLLITASALVAVVFGAPHPDVSIHGGDDAALGQFPFIVALNNSEQFCDGSIINKNWVVTAAHCIYSVKTNTTTVLAGTNKLDSGGTTYKVSQFLHHPDYNTTNSKNDIGLIQIVGEFEFSENLQPVEFTQAGVNASCQAVGWGGTEEVVTPENLKYVGLTALGLDDCKRITADYNNGLYLGEEQVCGYGPSGKGACYGDSGGPFVCDGKLAGVTSYAFLPCARGVPDVYTRPTFYVDWINSVVNAE